MWRQLKRSYAGASLYTWGSYPQSLGRKEASGRSAGGLKKVETFQPGTIKHVAMGPTHSIVICKDNSIYAFGKNSYGQLGMRKEVKQVLEPTKLGDHTLNFKETKVSEYNTVLLDGKH